MFDTKRVSGEAGLEHSQHDFEADLELASGPTLIAENVVYEQHQAEVRVVDRAMVGFNGAHLALIDRLIEANENMLWAADGSPSLAEWLTDRYRMSSFTGRTLAKITQALPVLPMIRRAFEQGRFSWDQLRAVVAIATPETDGQLAETAPGLKPSEIRATARKVDQSEVEEAAKNRYVTYQFHEDRPVFEMNVILPDEEGAAFITALSRKAAQIDLDPDDGSVPGYGVSLANALVKMGSETLAADADHDRATLLVRTDIPTILGIEGSGQARLGDGTTIPEGTTITNPTLRRLACDARIQLVVEDPIDGVIGIGRTSRTIPGWLNRIVRTRDGGCRFADCERTLWLQVHHLKHWADGGPTDLHNLITLCGFHHRLIHNQGWRIKGNPNGKIIWITKWGTEFERHPDWPGLDSIKTIAASRPPIKPPLRRTA